MKTYKIYFKSTKLDSYPPRRVEYVDAKDKASAKKKAMRLKGKREVLVGIEESNGCDCGQMWCPTCHG